MSYFVLFQIFDCSLAPERCGNHIKLLLIIRHVQYIDKNAKSGKIEVDSKHRVVIIANKQYQKLASTVLLLCKCIPFPLSWGFNIR